MNKQLYLPNSMMMVVVMIVMVVVVVQVMNKLYQLPRWWCSFSKGFTCSPTPIGLEPRRAISECSAA